MDMPLMDANATITMAATIRSQCLRPTTGNAGVTNRFSAAPMWLARCLPYLRAE